MKTTTKTIAVILSLAIIISLAGITITTHNYTHHSTNTEPPFRITAKYTITITRPDGKTITITKQYDPITRWWIYAVLDNLLLRGTGKYLTWYDTSGTARTLLDWEEIYNINSFQNPKPYLAVGNGTGTVSINDYKLFNQILEVPIAYVTITDNTTTNEYIITYYSSFISQYNFTLTEMGLILKSYIYENQAITPPQIELLICHDLVSPSINIIVNDTISVRYYIILKYNSNGGLTENFYHSVIDYMLGTKSLGGALPILDTSGESVILDVGWDKYNAVADLVSDFMRFYIGYQTVIPNPPYNTYYIQSNATSYLLKITLYEGTNYVDISIITNYIFTTSTTKNCLAIALHTDISTQILGFTGGYVIMFVSYFNPLLANANQTYVGTIIIHVPMG